MLIGAIRGVKCYWETLSLNIVNSFSCYAFMTSKSFIWWILLWMVHRLTIRLIMHLSLHPVYQEKRICSMEL